MVDKWKYRLFTDKVVYEPEAGPTVQQVISESIEIAQREKKPVELKVNDVVVTVKQDSSLDEVFKVYLGGLNNKYKQMLNVDTNGKGK